ncbi:hypothetical protein LLG46_12165 [bacterium]|nr:hypothetical protein [bacterium]
MILNGRVVLSVLLLLIAMFTIGCARQHAVPKSDTWSMPKGYGVGSVAWSPKGDKIAFSAARWKDDMDPSKGGLSRNSIWLLSLSNTQGTNLKQLVTLKHKANGEGIATTLFWLDDNRIGWATQDGIHYTFMQMELDEKKPRRLTDQNFSGDPSSDRIGGSAPGDVYYDSDSRTLLFSGSLAPSGVFVRMLPLSTKKVRNLSVPFPNEKLVNPWMDVVTICGSLQNPQKPTFYIAASVLDDTYECGGSYLWLSNSYSLKQDKIITRDGAMWPRTSPDSKLLACVQGGKLVLYDLASDKHKVLVKFSGADSPAAGWCSYSWSPDGKMIAYADGSRIKIVDMPSKL